MNIEAPYSVIFEQGGTITIGGDFVGRDKIVYTRSQFEELNDFLSKAMARYESQLFQTLRTQPPPVQPYKFLYAFDLKESESFFGRERAKEALLQKVRHARLTILHAKSGAGKSSLLQAGIGKRLIEEQRLPVYIHLPTDPDRWQSPVDLAMMVKQALILPAMGVWPAQLDDLPLSNFLSMAHQHLTGQSELVVVLDQFEAVYLTYPLQEQRQQIIHILTDCINDERLPLRFVIALRKEYFSDLSELKEAIHPHIHVDDFRLDPMNRVEAGEAILSPLATRTPKRGYAPDLLEKLLDDLDQNGMELPHLQILCTQLYKELGAEEQTLTLALYERLGGAEGVLGNYLERVLEEIPADKTRVAREVLKALVGSVGTKRELSASALYNRIETDPTMLDEVLALLVNHRLLQRNENRAAGEEVYVMAHGYLAERVSQWINRDEYQFKQVEEMLGRAMATWRVQQELGVLHQRTTEAGQGSQDAPVMDESVLPAQSASLLDRKTIKLVEELPNRHLLLADLPPGAWVLLVRSLVALNIALPSWLGLLRNNRAVYRLLAKMEWDGHIDPELEDLLDLRGELALRPPQDASFGPLASLAVCHPKTQIRQTAAIALSILAEAPSTSQAPTLVLKAGPPWPAGLERLYLAWQAFGGRATWRHSRLRQAELWGALADADPVFKEIPKQFSWPQRTGVWLWQVLRRFHRGRRRTIALTLGAAIGSGLGYGLLRAATAALLGRTVSLAFATNLVWGALVGASIPLGVKVAQAMALDRGQKTVKSLSGVHTLIYEYESPIRATIVGALCLGIAHLLLVGIFGVYFLPGTTFVGSMGFIASLGLSLALYNLFSPDKERKRMPRWLCYLIAVLPFILVQGVFLTIGKEYQAIPTVYARDAYKTIVQFFDPSLQPAMSLVLPLLDAAAVGLVLTFGIMRGLESAIALLNEEDS